MHAERMADLMEHVAFHLIREQQSMIVGDIDADLRHCEFDVETIGPHAAAVHLAGIVHRRRAEHLHAILGRRPHLTDEDDPQVCILVAAHAPETHYATERMLPALERAPRRFGERIRLLAGIELVLQRGIEIRWLHVDGERETRDIPTAQHDDVLLLVAQRKASTQERQVIRFADLVFTMRATKVAVVEARRAERIRGR